MRGLSKLPRTAENLELVRRGFSGRAPLRIADKASSAVVYVYARKDGGEFYAAGFQAKRFKPDLHYRYRSAAAREKSVTEFFANVRANEKAAAGRKVSAKAPHKLEVGHVLSTCWGHDQTNVEFYEVTRLIGACTVELRQLAESRESTGHDTGNTFPLIGEYVGEPLIRRARPGGGGCKINESVNASMWSGRVKSYSSSH